MEACRDKDTGSTDRRADAGVEAALCGARPVHLLAGPGRRGSAAALRRPRLPGREDAPRGLGLREVPLGHGPTWQNATTTTSPTRRSTGDDGLRRHLRPARPARRRRRTPSIGVSAWATLASDETTLVTSNYVVLETIAVAQHRLGLDAVRALIRDVLPPIDVVFIDETVQRAALLGTPGRRSSPSEPGGLRKLRGDARPPNPPRVRLRPSLRRKRLREGRGVDRRRSDRTTESSAHGEGSTAMFTYLLHRLPI